MVWLFGCLVGQTKQDVQKSLKKKMFLDTTGLANEAKKKVIKGHFLGLWWVSPLVALINKEPLDSGPPSHGSQQKGGYLVSWAHFTKLNQNKALVGFRANKVFFAGFWCYHHIPGVFPWCSQCVLQVPMCSPRCSQFHPIPFAKILYL